MKFEKDLYVIDEIYQSYLKRHWDGNAKDCIHFNHASITAPLPMIHHAAQKIADENLPPSSARRHEIIERTRRKVARLVNLKKQCLAFANNTTDAASLVFWLVGLKMGDSVVTTDAENESIPRIFKCFMDHANPADGWVAWQNFGQYSNSEIGLIKKCRTGIKVKTVKAYGVDNESFMQNLTKAIDDSTKLIVFCHVLRENGRIMPVKQICEVVRKVRPDVYTMVDGAQCLGTLPRVDFGEYRCDFYVATPHKTLCSETTGLLYIHPKHLHLCRRINEVPESRQIIKRDQFSQKTVRPNSKFAVSLPEIRALDLVIDYYKENGWLTDGDFSYVDAHLGALKEAFIDRLRELDAEIISPVSDHFTNFICSFRVRNYDNRKIVR